MILQFVLKSVYGVDRYYPHNSAAKAICSIAERKTLDKSHLNMLDLVNFEIIVAYTEKEFNISKDSVDKIINRIIL